MWNLTLQPQQTSYLHYHNVYGHQTWQGGDLPWGAPTHEIIWPSITWSWEITWQTKTIISPLLQFLWPPSLLRWSLIALITRSWKVTWQTKPLYLPYQSAYDHQTWQNYNLLWWAPTYKVTWAFDHVVLRDLEIN